jgi:hypothetical protein
MRERPVIGDQEENVGLLGLCNSLKNRNVTDCKKKEKIFHKAQIQLEFNGFGEGIQFRG